MPGTCPTERPGSGLTAEVLNVIRQTDAMAQALNCIEQEPLQLLGEICRQFEKAKEPVPDYNLHPSGYIGEVSLKALVEAGLVKSHAAPRYSLFRYEPTEEGLKHYHKLSQAGYYERRRLI